MIMETFIRGEDWGVTYSGRFYPTEDEKAVRYAKDCEKVYTKALIAKL